MTKKKNRRMNSNKNTITTNSDRKVKNEFDLLIESDDDFPSDYEDLTEIPAYQDDKRFEGNPPKENSYPKKPRPLDKTTEKQKIKANNLISSSCQRNNNIPKPLTSSRHPRNNTEVQKELGKSLVAKGILCEWDLFCLKSIEPLISDDAFLWFIDFLMDKDLYSEYAFRHSCLVLSIDMCDDYNLDSTNLDGVKVNRYEIVKC